MMSSRRRALACALALALACARASTASASSAPTTTRPRALRGSFKGTWIVEDDASARRMTRDGWTRGEATLRLRASDGGESDVVSVVGELVLRKDEYVGTGDAMIPLEGVYERRSGTAHAHGSARTTKDFETITNATSSWMFREGNLFRESLRAIAMDLVEEDGEEDDAGDGGARDSYSRDDAVRRAGKTARERFLRTHDAGTYPSACKFSLHAYLDPIDPSSQSGDVAKKLGDDKLEKGESDVDVLDRQIEDARPLEFEEMEEHVSMVAKLVSVDCGITVHMELESEKLETWYRKARLYSYTMIAVTIVQGYVLLKQLDVSTTQAALMRVSLASIGMRSVVDSYFCLAHLTAGIVVEDLFLPLSIVAAGYFILFSILEMKHLIAAWRVRRPDITSWIELRVQLGAIYSRFYAGFIGGLFLAFWLSNHFIVFLLITISYWLPQIWRNAYYNHRQALEPWYVILTSFSRIVAPLYVYGCPSNFLRVRPNYFYCTLIIVWTTAQCGVLLAQYYVSPRYGFPDGLFPEVYDYHRALTAEVLEQCGIVQEAAVPPGGEPDIEMGDVSSGVDCVICMNSVQIYHTNERMVTPCNHFFHTKCLTRWMDIKQECPTCRRHLPPM